MVPVAPTRLFIGFAMLVVVAPRPTLSAADTGPNRSLIEKHCLSCHNDNLRTAGVSLQELDPADVAGSPAIWEKVLRKVSSGEMPPDGAPAPEAAARAEFVARLAKALDRAAAVAPNPGRAPAHRLNRAEYGNAVRDLLALDIDVSAMLPGDDSGYGFDNIADVLSLSPALLERYLVAARRISRLAAGNPDVKPQKETSHSNRESGFLQAGHQAGPPPDPPFGAGRGAALRYYFPLDGEYEVSFAVDRGETREIYETHDVRVPVKAGLRALTLTFLNESSRPERIRPGPAAPAGIAQPPLDLRLDGRRVQLFEQPPAAVPFTLRSISIDGPYNATGPGDTPSRRKIFSCRPAAESLAAESPAAGPPTAESPAAEPNAEPCARRILSSLARLAYRRPVDAADVGPLMAVYQMGRAAEGSFERGVEKAVEALLVSPNFLFRIEKDPAGIEPATPYRISDIELASRLSFFLWSGIPDEELLRLAEQELLHDPAVLERQVRRMLADRRSKALVENFAGQWLHLRNVAKVKPDEVLFPEFDGDLRQAMQRETELFFENILKNNRSIFDLLDANNTFLNERLAEHYGAGKVYGPQFREVPVSDPRRGGLLGQASILTVTSYPNRTSVVVRGKWILENLFGMPPPPPPPNIPELEEAGQDGKRLTMRQAMSRHSRNPTCAACHTRMDPIGFALENYDAIGRRREQEGGAPIDSSGELPGGVAFDGPGELKQVLATHYRDSFASTVTEKLLTYALGRGLEYYDKPTVRSIVRQAERNEYRLADMIVTIVKSIPFQMRRSPES